MKNFQENRHAAEIPPAKDFGDGQAWSLGSVAQLINYQDLPAAGGLLLTSLTREKHLVEAHGRQKKKNARNMHKIWLLSKNYQNMPKDVKIISLFLSFS